MPAKEHPPREPLSAVEASDGYRLRYRVWPARDAAQATLVLLNGIMSNSSWFGPIVPALGHLHVVGADRRGSGPNADARGDAPSAGQLVDDVLRIVEAEHVASRPLVLLGWCWGAALAVAVGHALGDRLSGLVTVTPGLFPSTAVTQAVAVQQPRIEGAGPDQLVVDSPIREEMFTAGPALEGFIRRDDERLRTMTPRLLDVSNKLARAAVARLARLSPPVLLVLAADDEATDNEVTRRAYARIRPGQLTLVELASKHGVQFDAPEDLSHHLRAFVERVRRA